MDSQRPFLFLSLLFLGFLVWQAWQTDHAPKPEIKTVIADSDLATTQAPNATRGDIPNSA